MRDRKAAHLPASRNKKKRGRGGGGREGQGEEMEQLPRPCFSSCLALCSFSGWARSSVGGSSSTKPELPFRDQGEAQSEESEAGGHLLSEASLASLAPSKSGAKLKCTPKKFHIRDTNQQVLVLQRNILKAVPDKVGQCKDATFYVLPSIHSRYGNRNAIFLAVSKEELCLCCDPVKKRRKPTLKLKKKNINELNSLKKKESLPFTFYKQKDGSYYTLESAANCGYFISTSCKPNQPVGVTARTGKQNINFLFEGEKVDLEK
ncbi:interleukin-37-like [Octodon degus]|uniref:Interleukin-37-like n=1 Tax=Octodon degus TaxID=10160 RepID=A0A6P6ELH7_OCTDE|nr:interleukin-37-like [Octodon degus]